MTTDLFTNNTFILYLIFAISVFTIDKFNEKQKIAIIYVCTYGMTYDHKDSCMHLAIFLILMMFLLQEYFTSDKMKLALFCRVHYKITDFLYMSIFQYKLWLMLIAFGLRSEPRKNLWNLKGCGLTICDLGSLAVFVAAFIWVFRVPEEFYTISQIYQKAWKFPYYKVNFNYALQERLSYITEQEDRLYWKRKKSYTIFSIEYILIWYRDKYQDGSDKRRQNPSYRWKDTLLEKIRFCRRLQEHCHGFFVRGHSTIPMQIIRILSYKHGLVFNYSDVSFKKYKLLKRKIYEVLYARMFFEGLKAYAKSELQNDLKYYEEYLVYLYPHIVQSTIDGRTYAPAMKAFGNDPDIEKWDLDQVRKMAYGFKG